MKRAGLLLAFLLVLLAPSHLLSYISVFLICFPIDCSAMHLLKHEIPDF